MMTPLDPDLLKQLAKKWLQGTINAKELTLLDSWYNQKTPEEIEWATEDTSEQELKLRLFNQVVKEIDTPVLQKEIPLRRPVYKLWPRIAVAAAVMAVLTLSIRLYTSHYPYSTGGKQILSGSGNYANDITPGKNKATLTLSNGKTILLSDKKSGVVIGTEELKYDDGTDLGDHYTEFGTQTEQITAATPRGGNYQLVLPDGTHVWLNADSKLIFSSRFTANQRFVKLEGEAYFEVAKDKTRPFIVETYRQKVEVLGTHFNINSYKDEGIVKTTLLEGSVKISSIKPSLSLQGEMTKQSQANETLPGVILKPGEQAVLTSNAIKVSAANTEQAMAWKKGYFLFENENIQSIMRKISRWYDVDITYQGNIADKTIEGTVSKFKNVSTVLEMLEDTKVVKFRINGRRITVMPGKKTE